MSTFSTESNAESARVHEQVRNSDSPDAEKEALEHQKPSYPEGGLRAWLVVLGAGMVLGCTFGYVSSFGYALVHPSRMYTD